MEPDILTSVCESVHVFFFSFRGWGGVGVVGGLREGTGWEYCTFEILLEIMYFMKLKSHVNLFNCDFPYVLKQDNHTTWTNQQHNNYLNYLEMSFVKQLQSMGSLSWTSCQSDGRPSQKQFADFNRSSEQVEVYCFKNF